MLTDQLKNIIFTTNIQTVLYQKIAIVDTQGNDFAVMPYNTILKQGLLHKLILCYLYDHKKRLCLVQYPNKPDISLSLPKKQKRLQEEDTPFNLWGMPLCTPKFVNKNTFEHFESMLPILWQDKSTLIHFWQSQIVELNQAFLAPFIHLPIASAYISSYRLQVNLQTIQMDFGLETLWLDTDELAALHHNYPELLTPAVRWAISQWLKKE